MTLRALDDEECPKLDILSPLLAAKYTGCSHHELLTVISATPFVMPSDDCSLSVTTSTTLRKASISSSTVPPSPAPERLSELPTQVGRPVFLAKRRARRDVRSSEDSTLNSGVEIGCAGLNF